MNIMGHPKEAFLCSNCLELFMARPSVFKLAMGCYWLFHFLQATKSQNVLTYKFTVNQLLQKSASVISGTALLNYKERQMELQSWADNTKKGNFCYKVGQLLLQGGSRITK